ncbi:MAG: hypothetical protein CNIPEHKO_02880 [Anaerolineales bacterium]|nr:hypothetical protein [Anaerolineales bacterium]
MGKRSGVEVVLVNETSEFSKNSEVFYMESKTGLWLNTVPFYFSKRPYTGGGTFATFDIAF